MSVSEVVAPPKKRSFLRFWLPLLIIGLALLTLAVMRFGPFGDWEAASFPAIEGKTWNYLALMDGKAFVRNHLEMACYDLTGPAVQ
jgi:hypothetical protein